MATPREIINEALTLPPDDKAELVDKLLNSLEEIDETIEKQWANEAESRVRAYEEGKLHTISLEEVLAKYK